MPGKHKNRKSTRDLSRPLGQRLTERERVEILTLSTRAGWSNRQIAKELGLAESTVRSCVKSGLTTPPPHNGRKPILTTTKRRRLIDRATQDAYHRRLSYPAVAELEGIEVCRRSLKKAFEKEFYYRRKAKEKPFLTLNHKIERVAWAHDYKKWQFEDWRRVQWIDAASFTTGQFGDIYVTRKAEEQFLDDCLVPKWDGFSSCMAYAGISGVGKGFLIIMDKSWGKVSAKIYVDKVLPHVYYHLYQIRDRVGCMPILMEDNASIHTAKLTQGYHAYHGVRRMQWPSRSPDLNPIENVWRLLKARIGRRFPKTDAEVRQYLLEEWQKLELDDFKHYIESMPQRCQAVIDADGGHTKW